MTEQERAEKVKVATIKNATKDINHCKKMEVIYAVGIGNYRKQDKIEEANMCAKVHKSYKNLRKTLEEFLKVIES